MLEILLEALAQRVGDLVEADELLDSQHLGVVARRARVQALDDGGHVAKDAGVHEGWGRYGEPGLSSWAFPPGHTTPGPAPGLPLLGGLQSGTPHSVQGNITSAPEGTRDYEGQRSLGFLPSPFCPVPLGIFLAQRPNS